MPDEWASIRSTERCVLPVLVGPRTAVRRERGCESVMGGNVEDGGASRNPLAYHNILRSTGVCAGVGLIGPCGAARAAPRCPRAKANRQGKRERGRTRCI